MPSNQITVQLNGVETEFDQNMCIQDAINYLKPASTYVAVELNGDILDRASFSSTQLQAQDIIEVIQPLGGGSNKNNHFLVNRFLSNFAKRMAPLI